MKLKFICEAGWFKGSIPSCRYLVFTVLVVFGVLYFITIRVAKLASHLAYEWGSGFLARVSRTEKP